MKPTLDKIKEEFRRSKPVCQEVTGLMGMISNKTRFRTLCLLAQGEFCVREIQEVVDLGDVSSLSHQLRMLRLAGLVEASRDGKKIRYSLADARVKKLIGFLRREYLGAGKA